MYTYDDYHSDYYEEMGQQPGPGAPEHIATCTW